MMNMKKSNENNKEVLEVTTTAQKWGNSLGIRIPKKITDELNIVNGSPIRIVEKNGSIVITPTSDEPTLDELLAKCKPKNRHEEIDFGGPVGREIF